MLLTVLVDNNALIDRYYLAEPGASYFLECDGQRFLFDTGFSGIFMDNAARMGIDLSNLNGVILSHGHNDHTWGLETLLKHYVLSGRPKPVSARPILYAHPDAFLPKEAHGQDIGIMVSEDRLRRTFRLHTGRQPVWLTSNLVFLGEIRRSNSFEGQRPLGKTLRKGQWEDDYLLDDSALAYRSRDGLVIITGCSHSGICNIVAYAQQVCHEKRLAAVVGGFHLLKPDASLLEQTVQYLAGCAPKVMYPCHCTGFQAKLALAQVLPVREMGVGKTIEFV
jgi:7,8-dihydropterin-6-yl-methyl-4-(beta-D-ribofuranosyl)aminobenzene 5'-phosphate synthase